MIMTRASSWKKKKEKKYKNNRKRERERENTVSLKDLSQKRTRSVTFNYIYLP